MLKRFCGQFFFSKLVWILERDWHNMVGLLPFVHSMFTTLLCCGGQVELLAYLTYVYTAAPSSLRSTVYRLDRKALVHLIPSWLVLVEIECTVHPNKLLTHLVLSKGPINRFKLVQQSRQQLYVLINILCFVRCPKAKAAWLLEV